MLEFNGEEKWFYVFPHLSETNGTLTIKDDEDVKYWIEKENDGLKMLALAVKHASQNGKNISIIDFSEVTPKGAACDFKYFAGLPVLLCGECLESESKEIIARPGVRRLSNDIVLVCPSDGTFKVRYEPDLFYKVFGIADVFMENLRKALVHHANANDTLEAAVQSLQVKDFKHLPLVISDSGKLKTADDVRFGHNKKNLFDLVYGAADDGSMKSWSEFAGKLKDFDPKYYKSLILFFLHWDGSVRVDFSTFSKNNFDNWQKSLNITYGRVLENLNVQGT